MELLSLCRTCLSSETSKDISELRVQQQEACTDIILFCLNIKVEEDSKVSTKLCLKCYRKIIYFYKFKTLALKNDTFLRTAESKGYVKNEIFLHDETKNEDVLRCESNDVDELLDIKVEPGLGDNESEGHSDNELLSVIKKIKYEFVSEDPIEETKENAPAKKKPGKRGRPKSLKVKTSKGPSTSQICDECGKTVKNLKEHSLLHLPASVRKRYPCKVCDKTFASYSARNKHNRIKHLGLKKTCPICNKSVVSMRAHTLLMHNSSELRYQCAPCGRRFISQSALDAHTSVHTKDRPHACDKCDKKFRSKIVLMQHTRQVHEKEKSHLCQFCSKSFFKKYHLQVHLRSHTKEKPYQCPDCDKSFSSTTILNNHRSVHSDVKSFECTLCSMTFARSGYLKVHMLSHTKEKKHPCKYCGVKFSRTDHRNRHQHTAHERHLLAGAKEVRPPARRIPSLTPKDTEALLDRQITLPVLTYECEEENFDTKSQG